MFSTMLGLATVLLESYYFKLIIIIAIPFKMKTENSITAILVWTELQVSLPTLPLARGHTPTRVSQYFF